MTPRERQYDILIKIAIKPGSNIMTLRKRYNGTNTEIIVAQEGESVRAEGRKEGGDDRELEKRDG